jgi:hypothetical protein
MENNERKNDPAVQAIIDRILAQHFGVNKPEKKSIGEIEDELMKQVQEKIEYI